MKLGWGKCAQLVIFLCMKFSLKKVSPSGNQVHLWLLYLMQKYARLCMCYICYFGSKLVRARETHSCGSEVGSVHVSSMLQFVSCQKKKKRTKTLKTPNSGTLARNLLFLFLQSGLLGSTWSKQKISIHIFWDRDHVKD